MANQKLYNPREFLEYMKLHTDQLLPSNIKQFLDNIKLVGVDINDIPILEKMETILRNDTPWGNKKSNRIYSTQLQVLINELHEKYPNTKPRTGGKRKTKTKKTKSKKSIRKH